MPHDSQNVAFMIVIVIAIIGLLVLRIAAYAYRKIAARPIPWTGWGDPTDLDNAIELSYHARQQDAYGAPYIARAQVLESYMPYAWVALLALIAIAYAFHRWPFAQ